MNGRYDPAVAEPVEYALEPDDTARLAVGGLAGEERLVRQPVFIASLMRSGSTLLRCVLGSHPEIHAPPELNLGSMTVATRLGAIASTRALGIGRTELTYLMWDALLHRQLRRSGKAILVEKTPNNIHVVDHLRSCWPDCRFIVLRRHPVHVADSLVRRSIVRDVDAAIELMDRWSGRLDELTTVCPDSPVVRYEDLVSRPHEVCRRLCEWLGIVFDAEMVNYGRHDHGLDCVGVGDRGEMIMTGRIQPPSAHHQVTPDGFERLHEVCLRWGYDVA